MADFIEIKDQGGTIRKVSVDEIAEIFVQRMKVQFGADNSATDVSAAAPLPTVQTGALPVGTNSIGDIRKIVEALPAGANAIGKLAANSGVDIGDTDVTSLKEGTIAHDSPDGGSPIKVGGRGKTTLITAVADNDRTDLMTDKYGRVLTTSIPPDQRTTGKLNLVNETAADIIAAPGATTILVPTAVMVTNASATVGTKVEIRNGTTVVAIGYAAAAGGGFVLEDPNGLFLCTTNTALTGRCVTTASNIDIFASAFKIVG